jgi:hypothetical protein
LAPEAFCFVVVPFWCAIVDASTRAADASLGGSARDSDSLLETLGEAAKKSSSDAPELLRIEPRSESVGFFLGRACQSKGKPSGGKYLDLLNCCSLRFIKCQPHALCVRHHNPIATAATPVTMEHVTVEYQNFNHALNVSVVRNIGTPYVNIRNAFRQSASHRVSQYLSNDLCGCGGVSPGAYDSANLRHAYKNSASSSSLTYDFPFLKILLNMNEHSTMAFNINATVTAVAPAYAAINASL